MPQTMPNFTANSRWLNTHWAPSSDQKKQMLDQQYAHTIQALNKKYSKITPQMQQKLQLAHHASKNTDIQPGAGMSPSAARVLPFSGGSMRQL